MIGPGWRTCLALALTAWALGGCTTSPMSRIDANRALYESWPFDMQEAVLNGKVVKGMDADMVRMTLGEPSEVTGRNGRKGVEEVWIYRTSSVGSGLGRALSGSAISVGGGSNGIYAPPIVLGGGGGSSAPIEDEKEVVFQNGVVVRADADIGK